VPESGIVARGVAGVAIGDEAGHRGADAGDGADHRADDRAAQEQAEMPEHRAHTCADAAAEVLGPQAAGQRLAAAGDQVDDLGQREQAEEHGHQAEAVVQVIQAQREAQFSRTRVIADHGQRQAEAGRGQPLDQRPAGQRGQHGQTPDRQHQVLGGTERDGRLPHHRDQRHQDEYTEGRTQRRGGGRAADRLSGLAALGHRGRPAA
jgi:hypothetical protein